MNSDLKQKLNSLTGEQTGVDFFNPVTEEQDQSFSYQIQLQKEYLQRLKVQRQKIEGLYSKYDVLLSQMKKKDCLIKEKQEKMQKMDIRIRELELNCQQWSSVHEENRDVVDENMGLKQRILYLQSENGEMVEQMKLRDSLNNDQKNQFESINDQLQQKLKSVSKKLIMCQQQLRNNLQTEKQRIQTLQSQHSAQISQVSIQNNALKNRMMKMQETVHMLRLDNQFMQHKINDQQENYTVYLKDLQNKIEKSQKEKKIQIQTLKNVIEEKSLENTSLQSRLMQLKNQLEIKQLLADQTKKVLKEQKKIFDEDLFKTKQQMNNEKLYFREQLMHCQNHIQKLERKLNQSLKREKELGDRMKRHQLNETAKRNLRQIEKIQLQKINKILNYQ